MTAVRLADTKDMAREAWLAERRRGIGGSDAAAIAGLSRWRSTMAVWLEKTGQVEPDEPGEAALWGTKLEDVVARHFAEVTGCKVQRCNAILQHPEHRFMLANIDRYVLDPERGRGILEVKTTSAWNKDVADDKAPDHYLIQCHHYLAVTGLQFAYLAILKGGQHYCHQLVERDEEIVSYLIQIESDFWRLVESRTPPAMDGSESSAEVLRMLYPQSIPDSAISLPPTAAELIEQYEAAKADETAAAERKEAAANQLKAMLGENEVGLIGERRVTWKTVTSSRLDTARLKADLPDIYTKYARESTSRRFEVR